MGAEFGLFFSSWLLRMMILMFAIPVCMWWVKRVLD